MKSKLLIVANNAQWASWPDKVEALKKWFSPRVDLSISVVHTSHAWIPFEQYGTAGQDGVGRAWYDSFIAPLGKGYDMVLFVVNKSQWGSVTTRGWRDGTDFGAVGIQIGSDEFEPFWKTLLGLDGEMFHQVARHEIMHGLFYIKCGADVRFDLPPTAGMCVDTTHYHWDRGTLEDALIDLVPTIVTPKPVPNKTIYIVHHTGTPMYKTNIASVLADQQKRYGRSFYQCFIMPDGKVLWQHKLLNTRIGAMSADYCVVGDFTKEAPTEAQLTALDTILGSNEHIPHGQAVKYGATKSECPGTLLTNLKKYRKELETKVSLLQQIISLWTRINELKKKK